MSAAASCAKQPAASTPDTSAYCSGQSSQHQQHLQHTTQQQQWGQLHLLAPSRVAM
jgi:hypothetical protein